MFARPAIRPATRLAAFLLAGLSLGATLATARVLPPPPDKTVAWLERLPAEVFDNTTEGIDTEELATLLGKGESENWKGRAISGVKYVATAKRPFSEVHITDRQTGATRFVEVLTYNEKAVSYTYWTAEASGKAMVPFTPSLLYRALNETGNGRAGPPETKLPADLRAALVQFDGCAAAAGSTPVPKPAACAKAAAKFASLRQRHAGKPWRAVIDRADRLTER